MRRALWRLLVEGTALAPGKKLLDLVLDDLGAGRCGRHTLPRGWQLHLRPATLDLEPPADLLGGRRTRQPYLPFSELRGATALPQGRNAPWIASLSDPHHGFALPVPGSVTLPDGRRISAELIEVDAGAEVPREACTVELDWTSLRASVGESLTVRWPRAGDRFRPLGAPGSRPLRRFLAAEGVPRAERRRVALVCDSERIVWVSGLRPCEEARVGPQSTRRVRLTLTRSTARDTARSDDRSGAASSRSAAVHVQGLLWHEA
jgi:tRNA(Ile)-lysidine synthetase-like protein